mgnify:CR=1 FL=1
MSAPAALERCGLRGPAVDTLGNLGLDMNCISAALHSVAKQKLFTHEHGEQADGTPMPHLWADEAEDKDFQPSLEKAMQAARATGDAGTTASAVTTLRLRGPCRACDLRAKGLPHPRLHGADPQLARRSGSQP